MFQSTVPVGLFSTVVAHLSRRALIKISNTYMYGFHSISNMVLAHLSGRALKWSLDIFKAPQAKILSFRPLKTRFVKGNQHTISLGSNMVLAHLNGRALKWSYRGLRHAAHLSGTTT